MTTVFITSLFVSFIYVSLEPALDALGMFIDTRVINFVASLSFSGLGLYLMGEPFVKSFAVHVAATAFLGMANIKAVERLYTFRPALINPVRQQ